ncbi:hypothetical protein MGN70_009148 [Eutypa lata]|nr:hypothetical protein MGN70_009148 [Eutypa lata]
MATVDSREDDFGVLPATIEHLYATGLVWLYVSTVPSIPRVWAATSREEDLAGFGNDAVYRYKESVYPILTDRFIGPLYTLLTFIHPFQQALQ